jgi:tRNA threonylcarbamoyladenosine biosynthesis protein TsaB
MITLLIDTADNKKITVGLEIDGKEYFSKKKISFNRTQVVLPMIDEMLKKHSLTPKDLLGVKVNNGPGSFTGIRVGQAIANTFSFVLKIPVVL